MHIADDCTVAGCGPEQCLRAIEVARTPAEGARRGCSPKRGTAPCTTRSTALPDRSPQQVPGPWHAARTSLTECLGTPKGPPSGLPLRSRQDPQGDLGGDTTEGEPRSMPAELRRDLGGVGRHATVPLPAQRAPHAPVSQPAPDRLRWQQRYTAGVVAVDVGRRCRGRCSLPGVGRRRERVGPRRRHRRRGGDRRGAPPCARLGAVRTRPGLARVHPAAARLRGRGRRRRSHRPGAGTAAGPAVGLRRAAVRWRAVRRRPDGAAQAPAPAARRGQGHGARPRGRHAGVGGVAHRPHPAGPAPRLAGRRRVHADRRRARRPPGAQRRPGGRRPRHRRRARPARAATTPCPSGRRRAGRRGGSSSSPGTSRAAAPSWWSTPG